MGFFSSNSYLIYRSSIFWSELLTWHLPGILWWCCEIPYTYDYSSRLGDHSKSVRFEKHNFKTLATGSVLGGYFNICDRLVWEFKLFLFHAIEIKLMHKIIVCVFGSWNKINPFITKYSKNRQFWNTFNAVSEIFYPCCYLWNNKADIVLSSFYNEWALLVHWWQRQAAVAQAHYPATNARLIHRLQSLVHSPAKLLGNSR